MSKNEITDKNGQPIHEGDKVWGRARGGKQEGKVEAILRDQEDVRAAGDLGTSVKNPPKVVFTDQVRNLLNKMKGTQ